LGGEELKMTMTSPTSLHAWKEEEVAFQGQVLSGVRFAELEVLLKHPGRSVQLTVKTACQVLAGEGQVRATY
jgi:hypothetical protein